MITADYCQAFAVYNGWMNRKLYEAAAQLGDDARKADRGAFFRSIHSTLNHILWGDRLWLGRFNGRQYATGAVGVDLYDDFGELLAARRAHDDDIGAWAASLTDAALAGPLTWYSAMRQQHISRPRWVCVVQMFNHQTHHRGQATTADAGRHRPRRHRLPVRAHGARCDRADRDGGGVWIDGVGCRGSGVGSRATRRRSGRRGGGLRSEQ